MTRKSATKSVSAEAARKPFFCLWVLIALHAVVCYSYGISRVYQFKNSTFDLGSFLQVMQTIVTIGIPSSSLSPVFVEQNWFGFHFSPILYLIAPFFVLSPTPETLQIIHNLCISVTAWPLYLTFRRLGATSSQALLWGAVYLVNPFILNAGVWDFHEVSLAMPVFGFGLWAVAARRFGPLMLCNVLLLMTKEHFGAAVIGFGLLWYIRHREWKKAAGIIGLGVTGMVTVLGLIMPHYRGGVEHTMFDKHSIMARYDWLLEWDGWKKEIPLLIVEWIKYAVFLLGPLALLELAGLEWILPAAGDFGTILLSKWNFPRSVFAYHSVTVMPMLIVAAYQGANNVIKWKVVEHISLQRMGHYILLISCIMGWIYAPFPLPLAKNIWETGAPVFSLSQSDVQAISDIRKLLPEGVPVGAQCNIGSWFFAHHPLFIFPYKANASQYLVANLQFPFKEHISVMAAPYAVSAEEYSESMRELLRSTDWGIAYWHDPWLVLQHGIKDIIPSRTPVLDAMTQLEEQLHALRLQASHSSFGREEEQNDK